MRKLAPALYHADSMARRIVKANIKYISLCANGATAIPTLYKSDRDSDWTFNPIVKADMEKGELTGIIYAPEVRDIHGDIADASAIQEMCYSFAKNGGGVDIYHDGVVLDKARAYVAQSFLVQPGDSRFKDMKTSKGVAFDAAGSWAVVLKVDDPELRKLYREGKWQGLSMGGSGAVRIEKGPHSGKMHRLVQAVADHLGIKSPRAYHNVTLSGDIDMDQATLTKMLDDHKTDLLKSVKDIVGTIGDAQLEKAAGCLPTDTPEIRAARVVLHKASGTVTTGQAAVTPAPVVEAEPLFKGDLTDTKAVAQFTYDVAVYKIRKATNMADPTSVANAQAEIAKLAKPGAADGAEVTAEEQAAGIVKADTSEARSLKLRLHSLQKGSNQTVGGAAAATQMVGLTKAEQDGVASGLRMVDFLKTHIPGSIRETAKTA